MRFHDVNIIGSSWITVNDQRILAVEESHALIMAAGYLKHNRKEGIFFRGQNEMYPDLGPSLYRDLKSSNPSAREGALSNKINEFKSKCPVAFAKFNDYAAEPLLQHYGLRTTWLDVVDNIWVALWFACHEAKVTADGIFLHFQRRIPSDENKYAYIYLLAADLTHRNKDKPGYWNGDNTELIDLRIAVPSFFLRPHAQHGLLFRCKGGSNSSRPLSYANQIRGIVRIPLLKAFDWLGDGHTVSIHSLFPPAYYDNGYKILLQSGVDNKKQDRYLGLIHHIGA